MKTKNVILTVLLLGLLCCICGNGLVRGVDLGLFSMKGYRVVDVAVAGIPNGTCCLRGSVTRALLDQVFVDHLDRLWYWYWYSQLAGHISSFLDVLVMSFTNHPVV